MNGPSVSADQLGVWVACALLFVNVYFKWQGSKTQKRQVIIETDAVSKPEFEKHQRENREEHQLLHERVSSTADDASTRMNEMTQDYNKKFQELPSQIVALLRNAGVIRDSK